MFFYELINILRFSELPQQAVLLKHMVR